MRRVVLLLVAALAAGSLAYAAAPPRSAPAYADRASSTLERLRSQTQTVRLWIEAVEAGKVTKPAARVAFVEAEEDARTEVGSFARYNPPGPLRWTEPLRKQVISAGERTVALLARVRIAAETGQWQRLPALAGRLDELQQQLEDRSTEVLR